MIDQNSLLTKKSIKDLRELPFTLNHSFESYDFRLNLIFEKNYIFTSWISAAKEFLNGLKAKSPLLRTTGFNGVTTLENSNLVRNI
jgi:hypothetical protein